MNIDLQQHSNLTPMHMLKPFFRCRCPFVRPSLGPALAAALAWTARSAMAANLLVNPSFEANSGRVIPVGWTRFAPPDAEPGGNYWIEGNAGPHSGSLYWKQWGASYKAGVSNIAGIHQVFGSAPGSIYQASGWFYTRGTDLLGVNCKTWIEVAFLGSSSNLLALYKSDDFTRSAGSDQWHRYTVNQACDLSAPVPSGDPYYAHTYAVTGSVSQLIAPLGTKSVRFQYAYSQSEREGGSAHFDDALLDQVSGPLPPVITNVLPLNMIFADPKEGLTFTVSSPSGFAIETNGISLVVNGVDVSGQLVVSGTASSKNAAYSGLESNKTYTAAITVTDTMDFTATTTTSFETTWVGVPPVLFLWEAEDFDFEGGKYINEPQLCSASGTANCYFGKMGIEGVDYHSVVSASTRLYRPDDPIATGIAGDALRKPLFLAGRQDYRIDPFIGNEWLNYTRDWPEGIYWVNARVATGEGLSGSITLSRVEADSTTTDLGVFTIASGRGWTAFENVLLRDANGNIANVALDGKATLRATSGGNLLPNFFMLSAAQLDFPVLSNLHPTGEHPFESTNEFGCTVTTVGATFPEGSIRLRLNGVDVSSHLAFTGSDSNRNVAYPFLQPNAIYTAIVTVTNSLGNGLALTNSFDTFTQANTMVEAEDFDFEGGQYIAEWYPGIYGGYGATTNVDYRHTTPFEDETFPYRIEGIPQEIARDYIRQSWIDWGGTDYHLAWFGIGDWAQYTRVYPTNRFFVYMRSAGYGPFQMELDEVIAGAGTTNQTTRRLGYWSGIGVNNQTHQWLPLTDEGMALPVTVQLGGLATLRLSTSTGNCHPSYLMLVPASAISLSASRSGTDVAISFPAQKGFLYAVFYRETLSSGHWMPLRTVLSDGPLCTVVDPAVGTRFYTVVGL